MTIYTIITRNQAELREGSLVSKVIGKNQNNMPIVFEQDRLRTASSVAISFGEGYVVARLSPITSLALNIKDAVSGFWQYVSGHA